MLADEIKEQESLSSKDVLVNKGRNLQIGFILDKEVLIDLYKILRQDSSEEIEYEVECSDGSSFECASLQEIINYPNPKAKAIRNISISNGYKKPRIKINFGYKWLGSYSVEYTVSGEDKIVSNIFTRIDDYIGGIIQWYSHITVLDFWGKLIFIFVLGIIFLLFFPFIKVFLGFLDKISVGQRVLESSLGLLKAYSIYGILILEIIIMNFIRKRIFPVTTFLIGFGIKRHKTISYIRNGILGVLFISIIASVIANLLTNRFTVNKVKSNTRSVSDFEGAKNK